MIQKGLLVLTITAAILASGCASSTAADIEPVSSAPSVAPSNAIEQASGLYRERKDLEKVREALKVLESARNPEKRDFEVELHFAQYSYFLGSRAEVDDTEAETVLKKGLEAAGIAKRLDPEKPHGHFWEAAIRGEQSRRSPMTVGIPSISKIRAGMNKVLEIDPGYQGASAYMGLGQLELRTRGLAGGDAEKAVEYLEKGMKLAEDNAYMHLYLAEAYFAVKRNEEAVETVNRLLKMKPDPDYVPEYEEARAKAEKLLKEKTT